MGDHENPSDVDWRMNRRRSAAPASSPNPPARPEAVSSKSARPRAVSKAPAKPYVPARDRDSNREMESNAGARSADLSTSPATPPRADDPAYLGKPKVKPRGAGGTVRTSLRYKPRG